MLVHTPEKKNIDVVQMPGRCFGELAPSFGAVTVWALGLETDLRALCWIFRKSQEVLACCGQEEAGHCLIIELLK